jgi:hypothetical protein
MHTAAEAWSNEYTSLHATLFYKQNLCYLYSVTAVTAVSISFSYSCNQPDDGYRH